MKKGKLQGYGTVFLDVDGTLLWVNLDVEGYVEDLSPYAANGPLTVEKATGPVRESMQRHIKENVRHRTGESLAGFKRMNAARTARSLGLEAPTDVLTEVADRRISFNPYPESERVLRELRSMGFELYVVSNWDVLLEDVLGGLGWLPYFDGIVASAVVGVEKPEACIFEEALRISGARRETVVHVGNDPVTDVCGASRSGLAPVFVDRGGSGEVPPEAVAVIPDLSELPELLGGRKVV